MSTVVLVIICSLLIVAGGSLYLWSRWADREATYEPEPLNEKEGNIYRLGIALGANHGFRSPG